MRAAFLLLACAIVTWAQTPAHTPHYPNTSNGLVIYGAMHQESSNLWPSVNTWLGAHFDWIVGGPDQYIGWQSTGDPHGSYPTKTYWAAYQDIPSQRPTEMYQLQESAVASSLTLEDMFLHSSVDMAYASGQSYTSRTSQFDFMEPYYQNTGNVYQGGVFLYNGSVYTDVTSDTWLGGATTISNTLCVGSMEPFDQMNLVMVTPRAGGTVTYKYWNGTAWSVLTPNSDGTSGLTTAGKIYFYPPPDWTARTLPVKETTPVAIPVTTSKFWVQIVVSGATTAPVYSTIKGDDWSVSSSGNNSRGWSATDSHRINVGTRLEYNPTPPANASAKFRYQARITGYGLNLAYGNPANVQRGVYSWGRYLADMIDSHISPSADWAQRTGALSNNYDGAFFDDAGQTPPTPTTPANATQYYDNYTNSAAWVSAWAGAYAQTISDLKTRHGTAFSVSTNGSIPWSPDGVATLGDASLVEWNYSGAGSPATWSPYPTYGYGAGTIYYDWGLPAHNPNSTKFYFQCIDNWSLGFSWSYRLGTTNWHYGDSGNRTPLMCLAMHYLGWNSNTGFSYDGSGATFANYSTVDQVYTYLPATTLTSPVSPNNTSCNWGSLTCDARTVTLASAAGCGTYIRLGPTTGGDDVYALPAGVKVYVYGPTDVTNASLTGSGRIALQSGPASWAGSASKFASLTFGGITPVAGQSVTWQYWNGSAWAALSMTSDATSGLTTDGTVSWTAPSDWAATTISGTTAYFVQWTITTSGPYFYYSTLRSADWKTFSTTYPIWNSYSSGDSASCIQQQHLSTMADPPASSVYSWTRWFPAMGVDIGTPDPSGLNGGARMVEAPWKKGGSPDYISGQSHGTCDASGCSDLWRRDFTQALVLFRPWKNTLSEAELDTPSQSIALGGTYYPLSADGTIGGGVTSVALRGGEGAILMKSGGAPPVVSGGAGSIRGTRITGVVIR
jgi:hypothetical protein